MIETDTAKGLYHAYIESRVTAGESYLPWAALTKGEQQRFVEMHQTLVVGRVPGDDVIRELARSALMLEKLEELVRTIPDANRPPGVKTMLKMARSQLENAGVSIALVEELFKTYKDGHHQVEWYLATMKASAEVKHG